MQLVLHRGGQRDGDVDWLDPEQLTSLLVYTGPRYLGVYRSTSPVEVATTPLGEAQVWTAVQ